MDNQYYVGIKLNGSFKNYYFSCPDEHLQIGDLVIVSTAKGVEAGTVSILPRSLEGYTSPLELKPILRVADARDKAEHERNVEDAKRAMIIARKEIAKLGLDMDVISAYYSHDGNHVTVVYISSEDRVDFRGLLPVLAPQLGARLELRQVYGQERARYIGGIGICGLPLCCGTFLNHFDGASIKQAKNQMLNIAGTKFNGPCGRWVCCLAYEDDLYTEGKKEFPKVGTVVQLDEGPYTVHSFNILSKTVQLVNATRSDYKTYSVDDVKAMIKGTYVRPIEVVKAPEDELPSFGIQPSSKEQQKTQQNDGKNPQNGPNQNKNRHSRHRHGRDRDNQNRNNNQNQQNQQKQQNKEPRQNQEGQGGGHRHHHRHHRPHRGNGNNGGNA